jgi:hypothetical protein
LLATFCNISIMLLCCCRFFSVRVTHGHCFGLRVRCSLRAHCGINHLVCFIHVGLKSCTRLRLVEIERLRDCWRYTFLSLFHLSDKRFLELSKVRY